MKICIECKHYKKIGIRKTWHKCLKDSSIDPVTGDDIMRDCRKKNPDGKCKDYEAKESKK